MATIETVCLSAEGQRALLMGACAEEVRTKERLIEQAAIKRRELADIINRLEISHNAIMKMDQKLASLGETYECA